MKSLRLAFTFFFLWVGLTTRVFAASPLEPWTGGSVAPFTLNDIDGKAHDLSSYHGKVVLVNFWATWCEPCRQELPSIQRLREKLAGKPFVVFAVNVDEPEARIRTFLKQTNLNVPVLVDADKKATRSWDVRVLPVTFILDKHGRVRYRLVGDLDWADAAVVGTISELLAGS